MRDPLIGTCINRYEIREAIHRSDVINVYKAYDTKLERFVLIKTIIHSSEYSEAAVDYFLTESKVLARLAHPNIAKVLDFGFDNGNLYLISELVTGTPLSDLMNHPMPWQQAINILLPLTEALIYAHARGVIHRDLKPANIIIDSDNQPILSDFSLMRIIEEEETRDMTGTNIGLGSPEYISPEQGQGLPVDFRSDIYSLGVILFEMVTGKKMFYATHSMEIVIQHIMADPPRPRSLIPSLPKMVEAVILNALSKDREKRYQTMEAFANALKTVIEDSHRDKNRGSRRPGRLALSLLAGLGLLVLVIGYFLRDRFLSPPDIPATATALQTARTELPRLTASPQPSPGIPLSAAPTDLPPLAGDPMDAHPLPSLPVIIGTRLPGAGQTLRVENINALRELARWERPHIRQVALIDNDQVLLAATSAGIYFYDPGDLTARLFFDTQGALSAFAVSDDGQWVATADQHGRIAVWSILDGRLLYQLQDKDYQGKTIKSMDFSPDSSKLVFCDDARRIHFWNILQDQYYPFRDRLGKNANKVLFLADGATVVSGGDEHLIMKWDAATRDLVPGGRLPTVQAINDLTLSADERYLAAALDEAIIEVWDLSAGQVINTIRDPSIFEAFTFIAFLPNQSTLLSGSADGFIRAWNMFGSSPLWTVTSSAQNDQPQQVNPVELVAVMRDGTRFVAGFADGLFETWDLVNLNRLAFKNLGTLPVRRVAVSSDDQLIAMQRGNAHVDVLGMSDNAQSLRLNGTLPRGSPISPDGTMISIVPNNQLDQLGVYPLSLPVPPEAPPPLFRLYDFPVNGSVSYSSDSHLLSAFGSGIFNYWSTSSGMELKEALLKRLKLCQTIYRRDGSFLAAASENGVIYLNENLDHFCQIRRNDRATSESFLPNGSIIAQSLQYQRVEVWIAQKGTPWSLTMQTAGHVMDVAVSKDGTLLAAASQGGTVEIYDIGSEKLLKIVEILTGTVNQVVFSNDGRYLLAGAEDGTLRLFGLFP